MSYDDDYDVPPPPDLRVVQDGDVMPPTATNPPAEQAVLGAFLLAPDLVPDLRHEISGGDFYNPHHGTVWDTILDLHDEGTTPDPVTVSTRLLKTGDLQRIGGAPFLHTLMSAAPATDPAAVTAYAAVVRDAARVRAVFITATKMRQVASTGDPDRVQRVLEDALELIGTEAMRFEAARPERRTGLHDLSWVGTSWPHVPGPEYGKRSDGHALFYTGRVNGLFGDPETGKTWLAQSCGIEAMNAGKLFGLIDVDHNGVELTVSRLLLLGAKPHHLNDPALFRYYEPDDETELLGAVDDLKSRRPGVAILDSIGEILPMLGVKSVDNDEITGAMRRTATVLADSGACVITLDHLPKSAEARASGYAIGGTAKKRAIDGSYIYCEVKIAPAPGGIGRVLLRIEKDRPGELRKTCNGKFIGEMVIDSTRDKTTRLTVGASSAIRDGEFRPTHLMETVSRLVEETPGITGGVIESTIRGKAGHIRAAVSRLLEDAYITTQRGPRNRLEHHSLKPYREADDEFTPAPTTDTTTQTTVDDLYGADD